MLIITFFKNYSNKPIMTSPSINIISLIVKATVKLTKKKDPSAKAIGANKRIKISRDFGFLSYFWPYIKS